MEPIKPCGREVFWPKHPSFRPSGSKELCEHLLHENLLLYSGAPFGTENVSHK